MRDEQDSAAPEPREHEDDIPADAANLQNSSPTTPQAPDRETIRTFVTHLLSSTAFVDSFHVEIAWTGPGETQELNRAELFRPTQIEEMVDHIVRTNSVVGQNVYMSAGLRRAEANRERRASRADVVVVVAVWTDFDGPGAAGIALQCLEDMGLCPTLVVQTGAHPHLRVQVWFLLIAPSEDLERISRVITFLSKKLGADPSVSNPDRVMRIAGTIAWPKKAGRVTEVTRILTKYRTRQQPYTVDEIVLILEAEFGTDCLSTGFDRLPAVNNGGRLSQTERLERSRVPGQWHNNVRDYIAHMVHGGATMETTLSLAPTFQRNGYSLEQTEKEMRVMAEGAFRKFSPSAGRPRFKCDDKGKILAVIENVVAALECPQFCGFRIRHDSFRDELMISDVADDEWRPFRDEDAVTLRMRLADSGFKPVGRELMRDALTKVGADEGFDSATEWLTKLPKWDGVPRVRMSLSRYFGADDTPYARAVSAYLWTAMAGRVLEPGCKVDMVLVLFGEQGSGKSSGVMALVPDPMFFAELNLNDRDADMSRKIRAKLVIELGELRGLKTKDAESIKNIITSQYERWTPKYKEFESVYARRCVFIGTTNDDEFLGDPTGERRWLPVRVTGRVDVAAINADRDQLWAEAREIFLASGVAWREAEELARAEHAAFKERDPWETRIHKWLHEPSFDDKRAPVDRPLLQTVDILRGAIEFHEIKNISQREKRRVGRIMRDLGFEQKDVWDHGRTVKGWVKRP